MDLLISNSKVTCRSTNGTKIKAQWRISNSWRDGMHLGVTTVVMLEKTYKLASNGALWNKLHCTVREPVIEKVLITWNDITCLRDWY